MCVHLRVGEAIKPCVEGPETKVMNCCIPAPGCSEAGRRISNRVSFSFRVHKFLFKKNKPCTGSGILNMLVKTL